MGKMSRDKGKRFEREIANKFKDWGYPARRSAQFCGNTGEAPDVMGVPGIHIEAKHQEHMRLYDWMDQAVRNSKGMNPVVIHKANAKPVLVTMRFDDWIALYNEWVSGSQNDDC
jgi:Holliday junction resolvase